MATRAAAPGTGPRLRQVAVDGMTLTEGMHPAGSALPWHHHDGPTICLVLDGAFAEYQRGGVIDCRPSTLKITPAGERHWNRFHLSDVRGLLVEIDPVRRARLEPFDRVLTRAHHSEGGAESLLARRLHAEFLADDDAAPLAMEGVLLELLACVARREEASTSAVPAWVRRARGLLQDAPGRRHSPWRDRRRGGRASRHAREGISPGVRLQPRRDAAAPAPRVRGPATGRDRTRAGHDRPTGGVLRSESLHQCLPATPRHVAAAVSAGHAPAGMTAAATPTTARRCGPA